MYVIGAITFILVLFLSLNLGFAMYDVQQVEQNQENEYEINEKIEMITEKFEYELKTLNVKSIDDIKDIIKNKTVNSTVFAALFVWFLVIAYYFSEKKNYISGKEYGTARWGNQNDIKSLFAANIKAKEIKEAKKMGNYIGYFFVWWEKKKKCKKYANVEKNLR